jgi:DNA-binding GntR family transcriptional regulator
MQVFFLIYMRNAKTDLAYEFIRARILNREFPPGHPLLTEQLSQAIGVSRTPVTEALVRLQADGLVTMTPRLGAKVKTVGFNDLCEICDMRLALEAHAAARAATRHNEIELIGIKQALETMRELTSRIFSAESEKPFLEELVRADVRFHIAIMAAAKNNLMKKEILRLHLTNRVVGGLYMEARENSTTANKAETDANHRAVMASHDEIYNAIARRDPNAARDAMERHIQDAIDKALALIGPKVPGLEPELTAEELAYLG